MMPKPKDPKEIPVPNRTSAQVQEAAEQQRGEQRGQAHRRGDDGDKREAELHADHPGAQVAKGLGARAVELHPRQGAAADEHRRRRDALRASAQLGAEPPRHRAQVRRAREISDESVQGVQRHGLALTISALIIGLFASARTRAGTLR